MASLELHCPNHLVSCEYNPKENSLLAGGCYNGQVCYWDDRSLQQLLISYSRTIPLFYGILELEEDQLGKYLSQHHIQSQFSKPCGYPAKLGLSSLQHHQMEL